MANQIFSNIWWRCLLSHGALTYVPIVAYEGEEFVKIWSTENFLLKDEWKYIKKYLHGPFLFSLSLESGKEFNWVLVY